MYECQNWNKLLQIKKSSISRVEMVDEREIEKA